MRTHKSRFVLCITFALAGCGPAEPPQASCLNNHAGVDYGTVKAASGGFEVGGNPGPRHQPMEVTQPAWSLRPATFGDPANDYPTPLYRSFRCRMLD